MPHGDDLDERFTDVVGQIGPQQQREMSAAAKRGARASRHAMDTEPEPLRREPDWDEPEPPRRRASAAWWAGAVLSVVILVGWVVVEFRPDLVPFTGVVPEETTAVRGPVKENGASGAAVSDSAEPFKGSPAEKWPTGAAGFVMPPAKAIGGLSKQDVARGLARTRKLLAGAYLDRKMMVGGRPTAFTRQLHPEQRTHFRKDGAATWLPIFAPKTAEFASTVIKVKGRTTISEYKEDGRTGAKLSTKYLIAYAIQRPGQPGSAIRLVAEHEGAVTVYREDGELVVWADTWGAGFAPARCDVDDDYIHPMYADSPADLTVPDGKVDDPYALDDTPDGGGKCQAVEGT
ncbi:hypothetical protein AB0K12_13580 [Nonomuraea sp. NPDC049419]|uniref:hypothetical protein n=1 Tax=Nonomuraea sp. NPDC049419 TaxID=3155772 RepID=UPI003436FCF7